MPNPDPDDRTLADDFAELARLYREIGKPFLGVLGRVPTARELEQIYNRARAGAARGVELAHGVRRMMRSAQKEQR